MRKGVKAAVAAAVIAALVSYICMAYVSGGLRIDGDSLLVLAKDYYWRFELNFPLFGKWVAAAGILTVLVYPQLLPLLWSGRGRFVGFALISLLWVLAIYDTTTLVRQSWPVQMVAAPSIIGIAYLVWRLETTRQPIAKFLSRLATRFSLSRIQWLLGFTAAIVLTIGCETIYRCNPLITDAESQVAQARILLSGQWALPISTAVREVIAWPNSTLTGPTYSQYPPGHIVLLIPFLALKVSPNFLSVLAGALLSVMVFRLGTLIGGRRAGVIASLLLIGSAWFFALNSSAMNHSTTALELVTAAYCLLQAHREMALRRRILQLFVAGFCLAFALATRPLTAATHIFVWVLAWCCLWFRNFDRRAFALTPVFRMIVYVACGASLPLVGFGYYNYQTTGHPMLLQYNVSDPEFHQLGFLHTNRFILTPILAVHHLFSNIVSLNEYLFSAPMGSLILLVAWWARSRLGFNELVLLALCVVQAAAYYFYHFFQLFIGPRFWYELVPLLAVLAALPLAHASYLLPKAARGIVFLTFLMFSISGMLPIQQRWVLHADSMDAFIQSVERDLPRKDPTVMVIPLVYSEVVGQLIRPGTASESMVLFVELPNEASARRLPDLKSFKWIRYPESRSIDGFTSATLIEI